MINYDKFKNFTEYENYLNKISHFWTMFNYWDSKFNKNLEKRKFASNKTITIQKIDRNKITYWAITVVNDISYLDQQIKMLEEIYRTNDENLAEKYMCSLNKNLEILDDFV